MPADDPRVEPPASDAGQAPPRDEAPSLRSLLSGVKLLVVDAQAAVEERLALLGLELRLAARALARMAALGIVIVLLLCTAWALLMVGLWMALTSAQMGPAAAVWLLLALNLAGAVLAAWAAWRCVGRLTLPATMRRLRHLPRPGGPSEEGHADAPAAP